MSDPVKNVEIEDVLSSIRRLVSEENRPETPRKSDEPEAGDRLVLTPALRVADPVETPAPVARDDAHTADAAPWSDPEATLYAAADRLDETDGDATAVADADAGEPGGLDTDNHPDAEMAEHGASDLRDADPVETDAADEERDAEAADPGTDAADAGAARNRAAEDADADEADSGDADSGDAEAGDAEADGTDAGDADAEDADTELAEASDLRRDDAQTAEREHDAGPAGAEGHDAASGAREMPAWSGEDTRPLTDRIAEMELRISETDEEWEPDGTGTDDYAGTRVETLQWQDHVEETEAEAPPAAGDPARFMDTGEAAPAADHPARDRDEEGAASDSSRHMASDVEAEDDLDILAGDEAFLDEESLRELVADIVRQELQGALGERITRNVRKLVRREIHRALTAQELE